MKKGVRYVAEPEHVREVSLRGSSSLAFWSRHLKHEAGLALVARGNKAQLAIVSAEMSWMGMRFREVSLSVSVSHPKANDACLLVQAFNSNRFFAWSERVLFRTPYAHAECCVALEPHAGFGVSAANVQVLHAVKSSVQEPPPRPTNEFWEGPVFLPQPRAGERRLFFGRFKGETTIYPFSSTDHFSVYPHPDFPILQALIDSEFRPEQWVLRPDATHGKSKTYTEETVSPLFSQLSSRLFL